MADAKKTSGDSFTLAHYLGGVIFIVTALVTSGMLAVAHLRGMTLPGCGEDQGCAELTAGKWGSVFGWPVSYLGFAYFLGLLGAWLVRPGGPGPLLRNIIRAGVLGSLFYGSIMLIEQKFCLYCAMTHGANLLLLVWVEAVAGRRTSKAQPAPGPAPALGALAGLFLLASVGLGVAGSQVEKQVIEDAKDRNREDIGQIIEALDDDNLISPDSMWGEDGFTGRWRQGDIDAPIRIVAYTDFQCPDCRKIDTQFRTLLLTRDDVSISHKHFPFCPDCNRHISRNMHPNACWAARAAEAAGIVRGNEGFWDMHHWLFDNEGRFETWDILQAGLIQQGYTREEQQQFLQVLNDESATLPQIREEVDEAVALGLYFTPMIFVNGVQLRGWQAPNAVINAVQEVAAANPPRRMPTADNPPLAAQKYVDDWEQSGWRNVPGDDISYPLGTGADHVEIVVWGDYREVGTQNFDKQLRNEILPNHTDVLYNFRHYPLDQSCNTNARRNLHPDACKAHQLVEAAAQLGGLEAFRAMHAFMMENPDALADDAVLRRELAGIGLSADAVFAHMASADVAQAINDDAGLGMRTGLRKIPWIFINGRFVDRWQLDGDRPIERIILRAKELPKTPQIQRLN